MLLILLFATYDNLHSKNNKYMNIPANDKTKRHI